MLVLNEPNDKRLLVFLFCCSDVDDELKAHCIHSPGAHIHSLQLNGKCGLYVINLVISSFIVNAATLNV